MTHPLVESMRESHEHTTRCNREDMDKSVTCAMVQAKAAIKRAYSACENAYQVCESLIYQIESQRRMEKVEQIELTDEEINALEQE